MLQYCESTFLVKLHRKALVTYWTKINVEINRVTFSSSSVEYTWNTLYWLRFILNFPFRSLLSWANILSVLIFTVLLSYLVLLQKPWYVIIHYYIKLPRIIKVSSQAFNVIKPWHLQSLLKYHRVLCAMPKLKQFQVLNCTLFVSPLW